MYCRNCGHPMSQEDRLCLNCGKREEMDPESFTPRKRKNWSLKSMGKLFVILGILKITSAVTKGLIYGNMQQSIAEANCLSLLSLIVVGAILLFVDKCIHEGTSEENKICEKCNAVLPVDSKFCANCGNSVSAEKEKARNMRIIVVSLLVLGILFGVSRGGLFHDGETEKTGLDYTAESYDSSEYDKILNDWGITDFSGISPNLDRYAFAYALYPDGVNYNGPPYLCKEEYGCKNGIVEEFELLGFYHVEALTRTEYEEISVNFAEFFSKLIEGADTGDLEISYVNDKYVKVWLTITDLEKHPEYLNAITEGDYDKPIVFANNSFDFYIQSGYYAKIR